MKDNYSLRLFASYIVTAKHDLNLIFQQHPLTQKARRIKTKASQTNLLSLSNLPFIRYLASILTE
jgi:hypothetical protein